LVSPDFEKTRLDAKDLGYHSGQRIETSRWLGKQQEFGSGDHSVTTSVFRIGIAGVVTRTSGLRDFEFEAAM
jgi:hypothetical protein